MEAWVRAAVGKSRSIACCKKEAAFETISHEAVTFTKLLDQRDIVVDLVEFRGEQEACKCDSISRVAFEKALEEFSITGFGRVDFVIPQQ